MANLTDRTALLGTPANDDVVHIVDKSDTTDGAAGTSKQISVSDLLSGVPAGSNTDETSKVSSNDTAAGYLNGKLVAGTNVTLVENNDGGNETLTINASVAGGAGDMTAAVYDPTNIAGDAFARANHTGTQSISTVTGLQTALDSKSDTGHTHPIDTTFNDQNVRSNDFVSACQHLSADVVASSTTVPFSNNGSFYASDQGLNMDASGVYTVPVSGFYLVSYGLDLVSTGTGTVFIRLDSSVNSDSYHDMTVGERKNISYSKLMKLTVGETISVLVSSGTGGNPDIKASGQSYFSVVALR